MFTGLIQEMGTVVAVERPNAAHAGASPRITVEAATIPSRLREGDSIAVSGVCLTALKIGKKEFSADLARETLERTSLGCLERGSVVNLELPARAGDPMGGHVVQGHVDGTGRLLSLGQIQGGEDWRLALEIPVELERYVIPQGSITVEGISLTVAVIHGNRIEIAIIPHTYAVTNLRTLTSGALINIETDVLAKYAEQMASARRAAPLSVAELIKLGF